MKLRGWEIVLVMTIAGMLLVGAAAEKASGELAGKLVRLHVVANSDTDVDQELKLRVRDAVLEVLETELAGVTEQREAKARIEAVLPCIVEAAGEVVEREGYNYPVKATLLREEFPTTEYETFSLPAGVYTSLRVTVGEGAGHNWWCVVFPPVCAAASMEEAAAAAVGLTEEEFSLITQETGGYVVRFRLLELWGKIRSLFD